MSLSARSETSLASVNPVLAAKVRAAAAILEPEIYLCVYSGLRNAIEQNGLYAKGRTLPGDIVTNAKAGQSMHNYGLAVDVVPYRQGNDGALDWNTGTHTYAKVVATLKAQGLVWGGDWVHFKDLDHFQLPGVPPSPNSQMFADYQGGVDLSSIWNKVAEGVYA